MFFGRMVKAFAIILMVLSLLVLWITINIKDNYATDTISHAGLVSAGVATSDPVEERAVVKTGSLFGGGLFLVGLCLFWMGSSLTSKANQEKKNEELKKELRGERQTWTSHDDPHRFTANGGSY